MKAVVDLQKIVIVTIVALAAMVTPFVVRAIVIETRTEARSSSGGVRAGAGESITTGPNRSSVQISNVLYGNSSGATSSVTVTKTENGVTETRREEHTAPSGAGVRIEASAGNNNAGNKGIEIKSTITPAKKQTQSPSPSVRATSRAQNSANVQAEAQVPNTGMPEAVVHTGEADMLPRPLEWSFWQTMVPDVFRLFISRIFGSFNVFS
jgi:hypothetical protein